MRFLCFEIGYVGWRSTRYRILKKLIEEEGKVVAVKQYREWYGTTFRRSLDAVNELAAKEGWKSRYE